MLLLGQNLIVAHIGEGRDASNTTNQVPGVVILCLGTDPMELSNIKAWGGRKTQG